MRDANFMNSKSKSLLWLALLSFSVTGCRTFNYTDADLERERRQISGFGTKPCNGSCWHEAHGFRGGHGGDFGPFHPTLGPMSLPSCALGKNP